MQDTFRHQGLRKKLIEELIQKGITNQEVLNAIAEIPRHLFFFDTAFLNFAYSDSAFPIGSGQTISQPFTVAFQTSLLQLERRQKVLEIGTGSGYQTAVLSKLGVKVFSIERQHELHIKANALLDEMRYKARCFYGDGFKGKQAYAPFDRILITCGAPFIPEDLKQQLKVGGRMVIPVGENQGVQKMLTVDKHSETDFEILEHGDFQFVPMLENTERSK